MCGICGRFDHSLQRAFPEEQLRALARIIRHRGPDDDGIFSRPGVGLAMRRLSIIDLAGGHQPIGNEDGSVQVVFNGEIYNYRELRSELLAGGHQLRTNSDTEVVAHLWEDLGEKAFGKLRGMFAIALWDERRKTLVLARDRIGIKPLYYAPRPDGLDFASEIKVLLALPETRRDIDASALASYFTLGYIPPPETAFAGVRELPPGHWLMCEAGRPPREGAYWSLGFAPEHDLSEAAWVDRLDVAIADAVESHLVSDVPLAAFLSGGLDSGAVVAYMAQALPQPPSAYTIRYSTQDDTSSDETALAQLVAARYGVRHRVIEVVPHSADVLDDLVTAFDQPLADTSAVPTYYLTRAVAADVKVALSGLGGDELFGGYERHSALLTTAVLDHLPAWSVRTLAGTARRLAPLLGQRGLAGDRVHRLLQSLGRPSHERYLGFITRLPAAEVAELLTGPGAGPAVTAGIAARLTRHFGQDPGDPLLNRALAMDYGQYLPGDILPLTDRLSMLHSLEVRVPLVDHRLVELAARIPPSLKVKGGTKKWIFRRLLETRLPPEILQARKQGFVGPMGSWLRTELRQVMLDSLSSRALRESGWLAQPVVDRMLKHHLAGTSDRYTIALWSTLMFARWHERYVQRVAAAA